MALINCPECEKEISDKVKACPHCGYPLEENLDETQKVQITSVKLEKMSPKKKKTIVISTIIIITLIIASIVGIILHNKRIAIQTRNEYIDNLTNTSSLMKDNAADAENLIILTAKVWNNCILKKSDAETDKYTIMDISYASKTSYYDYDFESDFNSALDKLFKDEEIINKKNKLIDSTLTISDTMKKLQNPNSEFVNCYNTITDLYTTYQGVVDLANSPSGTYQTYTCDKNEKIDKFITLYKKLQTQIPEKHASK